MATAYKLFPLNNVGTGTTTVRTVPGATTDIGIGFVATNVAASTITFSAWVTRSAVDYDIVRNVPIPAGASLNIIGSGSKVVLEATDVLNCVSSAAASVDVLFSCLEIT